MPKLPRTSAKNIIRTLERMGFTQVRTRGSHVIMRKEEKGCAVPLHKEVAVGTLAGILRQAGVSSGEFMKYMK